ncbi:Uma2 family endonuclease [Oceanobacillus alkalisoli]|uniref:Uma2 family endonuclease n=1 Tax=Oceanobacillus alkalisoli TaxID=2925113 RepID=UPI001F11B8C9|nr:Uma2 family endonuclease [Oceanobacillus alkalisoli]
MDYGVKEYWIANPMLNTITIYSLNRENMYEQSDMKTDHGKVTSKLFGGIQIDLSYLFKE